VAVHCVPRAQVAHTAHLRLSGRLGGWADKTRSARKRKQEAAMQHMKWWGWGEEGVSFRHDDKPAFAALQ